MSWRGSLPQPKGERPVQKPRSCLAESFTQTRLQAQKMERQKLIEVMNWFDEWLGASAVFVVPLDSSMASLKVLKHIQTHSLKPFWPAQDVQSMPHTHTHTHPHAPKQIATGKFWFLASRAIACAMAARIQVPKKGVFTCNSSTVQEVVEYLRQVPVVHTSWNPSRDWGNSMPILCLGWSFRSSFSSGEMVGVSIRFWIFGNHRVSSKSAFLMWNLQKVRQEVFARPSQVFAN